ncbi:unnamed protein product [Nippostrongylus brasiliensis]|uniref:Phorbol-ester/DAG-type domain-containing protein n=1 Tax=Nippostrongylus brasiliensis TaxID=27835 RepID=A0A158QZB4_NIPBR|nr:unnamed protein product [Nippostrongylus brasiliensis]
MSQLGIGDTSTQTKSMPTPPATSPRQDEDDDSISYHSISLDDCTPALEWDEEHWDFGASFLADLDSSHAWNDTLDRQHFGPLKDLITMGGQKAEGHRFVSVALVQPTWCDKCGDFIWGLLKQASKCESMLFYAQSLINRLMRA